MSIATTMYPRSHGWTPDLPVNGWTSNQPAATGQFIGTTQIVGLLMAGAAVITSFNGPSDNTQQLRIRNNSPIAPYNIVPVRIERSSIEDLQRIREVLSPAISDLAASLHVSRQSVYNWINGDPIADGNAAKLQDLAKAADILAAEGFAADHTVLRRKFSQGRTLLQLVRDGESAVTAMSILVQDLKKTAAQKSQVKAIFEQRPNSVATADFDLPAPNDAL